MHYTTANEKVWREVLSGRGMGEAKSEIRSTETADIQLMGKGNKPRLNVWP